MAGTPAACVLLRSGSCCCADPSVAAAGETAALDDEEQSARDRPAPAAVAVIAASKCPEFGITPLGEEDGRAGRFPRRHRTHPLERGPTVNAIVAGAETVGEIRY